ncbi:MAG: class B sortase [Oscillospiraceae bacterium]|nr:class B sortase [Oscillospiraceae bacterium]
MSNKESLHFSTAPDENDAEVREILKSIPESAEKQSSMHKIDTAESIESIESILQEAAGIYKEKEREKKIVESIPEESRSHKKYTVIKQTLLEQQKSEPESIESESVIQPQQAQQFHKNTHDPGKKVNTGGNKNSKKRKKKRKRKSFGSLFPEQGDSFGEALRKMVFLASSTVFIVCLFLIGQYFWDNYQARQINDPIRHQYEKLAEEETKPVVNENYEMLDAAKSLLELNSDVIGYIQIPNKTGVEDPYPVSYPVVQRRNALDGNAYYLDKNINGEPARSGAIFMDYRNFFDYMIPNEDENGNQLETYKRVAENSQNLIIYGHNMHDFSMFGNLKSYINTEGYYEDHAIVELNSNFLQYQYKIFGMIVVDVDDQTDTKFEYWNTINFKDKKEFYDYVNEVKRRTIRLTDVDVTYGDQILTLSTCNSTFNEGRLVVFARLLRDGEDLYEGCTSTENPNVKWSNSYYKWHKNTYDPNAEFVPYGE